MGFFSAFERVRWICQQKNVLLTWGSWQVVHMGQLFDCTAYNYINSELLPDSWFMNVHDCDLFFKNSSKYLSLQGNKIFYSKILVSWFYFTYFTENEANQGVHVCICKASSELCAAGMHPAHILQSPDDETHHLRRAPETLGCHSIHTQLTN